MSFWDNVKKFTQPYSDEEYDDYDDDDMEGFDDEAEEPQPRTRRPAFGSSDSSSDVGSTATSAPSAPSTSGAAPSSGFSGQVLNMNSNKQEVVLFHAKTFDDAAKAADELRGRRAVILNMENVEKTLTRRVVDFLSGCIYALDGKVKKIAQSTYLFCPHSMDIVGDLEQFQGDAETYL